MFGDPSGPVGVAVNSTLMINMLIATTINIVCPATNHLGLFKVVGLESIVEGAQLAKTVRSLIGKESKMVPWFQMALKHRMASLKNNGVVFNPVSKTPVVVGTATGNKSFDIPHCKKENKRIRHFVQRVLKQESTFVENLRVQMSLNYQNIGKV